MDNTDGATRGTLDINFDALLNGWGAQSVNNNIRLDASSHYCNSETGRAALLSANWTINDLGKDCSELQSDVRTRMDESLGSISYNAMDNTDGATRGTLDINFIFDYVAGVPLNNLMVKVTTANNAFLKNADVGSGDAVGSTITIDNATLPDIFSPLDDFFDAGETLSVLFSIGLQAAP